MFKLRVSKTLSKFSIAFLLSGPGIVVRMCGLKGSSGKKGCSEGACSASCAVAIRAAVLVVVVIGLTVERRRKGRERDEVRRIEVMIEVMLRVEEVGRGQVAFSLKECGVSCGAFSGKNSLHIQCIEYCRTYR